MFNLLVVNDLERLLGAEVSVVTTGGWSLSGVLRSVSDNGAHHMIRVKRSDRMFDIWWGEIAAIGATEETLELAEQDGVAA